MAGCVVSMIISFVSLMNFKISHFIFISLSGEELPSAVSNSLKIKTFIIERRSENKTFELLSILLHYTVVLTRSKKEIRNNKIQEQFFFQSKMEFGR